MNELFRPQPKPRYIARRRRVTLTVSLIAHAIMFSFVAWLALHAKTMIDEDQTIAAFYVPAPPAPAPPPPKGPKSPEPKTEQKAVENTPTPTPTPTTQPTQVTAEPPSTSIAVQQGADPAGVLGGTAGGTGVTLGVAPPSSEPIRVGGNIKAPALAKKVPPEYPKAAQQAHIEGNV